MTLAGQKVSALFCVLTAPKRARGKLLTGMITASYSGVQKSRTFTAKIKCADDRCRPGA